MSRLQQVGTAAKPASAKHTGACIWLNGKWTPLTAAVIAKQFGLTVPEVERQAEEIQAASDKLRERG